MTPTRSGFSLLEMLLALAILGTSLGILSQVAMTGTDAALEANLLSQARMMAQAKMAEILVEGISPSAVPPTPIASMKSDETSEFQYSVNVTPAAMDGLLLIRIDVQAIDAGGSVQANYSLSRFWIDPLLGLAELEAEEQAAQEEEAAL